MDPLEHSEFTSASGDGVGTDVSQIDIPAYARSWGASVRRPKKWPKLWDVTIDRDVIFEMESENIITHSGIPTQMTSKYIVPRKCVNCKKFKRICSRTRPTCISCQRLAEQCQTDDTSWDSLPSLRIPRMKGNPNNPSLDTTELASVDNGHKPWTLLGEATFTAAQVGHTVPPPPFHPDIVPSGSKQSPQGNQSSNYGHSAPRYGTYSAPSPSHQVSLSSPLLENMVPIIDELEYSQDNGVDPRTKQLTIPDCVPISKHLSLPQLEETLTNNRVFQTEVRSQPNESQDPRNEDLTGIIAVAPALRTVEDISQDVSYDFHNQENIGAAPLQMDSSVSDDACPQLSYPNQETDPSLTIPLPRRKSSPGQKRGQTKKAKSKPSSLAKKPRKASKPGSQSKENRAARKTSLSKFMESASQPGEVVSVPPAVFSKKKDLCWTFVKCNDSCHSSSSGTGPPAPQEQIPVELKPRVWTSSRKELLSIFPEFSKSHTGLAWLCSETPMLLLENSVFGSSWDGDININLSMTWDFSCDESDLEPSAQNILLNHPPVSDILVRFDEEDETITSLGSLEYPPRDELSTSDEMQNIDQMQERVEGPLVDARDGVSLGGNPYPHQLSCENLPSSSIAERSLGSLEDITCPEASSEYVCSTNTGQAIYHSQGTQGTIQTVKLRSVHDDVSIPDSNPSLCGMWQPSMKDAVGQPNSHVFEANAIHGRFVVLDDRQSIRSQFPTEHAPPSTLVDSGSCFTIQDHRAKGGENLQSEPPLEEVGPSYAIMKPINPRLPEKKPPEVEVLMHSQSLQIPLVVIASRTCALIPANLPSQYAYSYLGFFFVSNMRPESLEYSSDYSPTSINGRVTWSLTLDWAPGGEELLTGSDELLPWWISPASIDGGPSGKKASHYRDLSGQYSSYLPLDLLALSTPSEPFPRGWFCRECGMLNEQRYFRHKICGNSNCKSVTSDQLTIGYVESLYVIRETQQNLPMLIPPNFAPESVEIVVTKWMDGMIVYRYGINENVAIKHVSTCNHEDLQEEPTRLLEYIQAHVPLLREDPSSPYFIHMATKSRVDNTRAASWEDVPVLLYARDLIQHYVQVYDEEESFSIDSLLTQSWVRSGSRKGKVFKAKTLCIVLFCLGSDVDLRLVPKAGFGAEETPETNCTMEDAASSREPFHEASQRIGVFHDDSGQAEPTHEGLSTSLINDEALAQDAATGTANAASAEPVEATSFHKDVLMTPGQNAGQEELPLAGRRKGKPNQQEDLAITLVHGDALILQGDDFECQIKRTGTTILLIGTQAAAASGGDVSRDHDGLELKPVMNYSWNPLEISRISEDVEIEEPPDVDPLTVLYGM